jgi:hypothetical protein
MARAVRAMIGVETGTVIDFQRPHRFAFDNERRAIVLDKNVVRHSQGFGKFAAVSHQI